MPFGFGGSSNRSQSSGSSIDFGRSSGSSFVDPNQQGFLDFLRNSCMDLFGGQQGGLEGLFGLSEGLQGQAQGLIGGLTDNPFLQALQSQAGGNPELVGQQTEQLGSDLGRFFNEQLVPGINSQGQQAGQFGGSRGGIGRGLAAQGVTEQFQRGSTAFQTADAQRSQQAAGLGGQLFSQGSQAGLQGLQGIFGLASAPFNQQFDILGQLASIFGDPTVLNRQSSFDFGRSQQQQTSRGSSFSFGGL